MPTSCFRGVPPFPRPDIYENQMPKACATERDAERVSREIFNLLRAGALSGCMHRLECFIDTLIVPVSKFAGFENVNVVPLALADLELDVENALEDNGIRTVGQYRAATETFIRRIPGIGPKRFARLDAAIETMIDEFVDWQIDGTIHTPTPIPLPADLQQPIPPDQQCFLKRCIETRLQSSQDLCQALQIAPPEWLKEEQQAAEAVLRMLRAGEGE